MDPLIRIGEQAPDFQLPDLEGENHSLEEWRGWIVVLNFWSAECTWCERVDRELLDYIKVWKDLVKVWWIASNANETQDVIKKMMEERKLTTVLLDAQQQVANMYGVQITPNFFVVNKDGRLAYQGAWDNVTFRQRVATQEYVPKVIEALADNRVPDLSHTPPYGCALVRSFAAES